MKSGNGACPYIYARTLREVRKALSKLHPKAALSLDTETIIKDDSLRIVQLSDGEGPPIILDAKASDLQKALVLFLSDRKFIIQNAKFDLRILSRSLSLKIPCKNIWDTYVASALLTNTKPPEDKRKMMKRKAWRNYSPNKLDSIAQRTLGIVLDKSFQAADWNVDLSLPENAPMLGYASDDVRYLHAIRVHQEAELDGHGMRNVYELERDLIPLLNEIGERGINVSTAAVKTLLAEALATTTAREGHLLNILGSSTVNPRSRKCQLLPALQALGPTINGEMLRSTDRKTLPLIDQADHPAVAAVLEWSASHEEAKQLTQWLPLIDENEIVHPQINQFGAISGRFTYRKPNVQQVKKSALRTIIVAPPGYLIMRADFRTIEIILAAVHYQETAILEQVAQGIDMHTITASSLFQCPTQNIQKPQRSMAKTTNFSLMYGRSLAAFITACRLEGLNLSGAEVENLYQGFDKAWPGLTAYKSKIPHMLWRRSYPKELFSMYGRRLILDPMLSSREIRGCLLNFPIQASGADVLKLTMLNIWQEHPRWLHLIGSVHDEMLAIVRPTYVTQAKALLREAAADATRRVQKCDIPIQLEIGVGKNWWEAIQDEKN
jgi:DNA polymerase I-like protein with 3'-5' exonuclease and polymerase domains